MALLATSSVDAVRPTTPFVRFLESLTVNPQIEPDEPTNTLGGWLMVSGPGWCPPLRPPSWGGPCFLFLNGRLDTGQNTWNFLGSVAVFRGFEGTSASVSRLRASCGAERDAVYLCHIKALHALKWPNVREMVVL